MSLISRKPLDSRQATAGSPIKLFDPVYFRQYEELFNDNLRPYPNLVCCIDVLEHVEPHLLDNVLTDLRRVTQNVGFFTVHTGRAVKTLSDGRNAHLIQQSATWWLTKLSDYFQIGHVEGYEGSGKQNVRRQGFAVLVGVKTAATSN